MDLIKERLKMSKILEVIKTEVENDYTTTAIASTVKTAVVAVDGAEETVSANEGETLVLVVDGAQKDLVAGKKYDVNDDYIIKAVKVYNVGGPKAAPWLGLPEDQKATYYFRQALLVKNGEIVEDGSIRELISGDYDGKKADQVKFVSDGEHFNGILLDDGTKYEITDSEFRATGDGGDDLAGWGAVVMADNHSEVTISKTYMETEGGTRCALYVDNGAIADVKDTVIYTKETPDTYEHWTELQPGMMKRVPFALGMEGTVRSLNVMADGQGKFDNCLVVSTGWGTLSCDSGTAYDICGTYCLDVKNTLSGIGTMEVAQEGKEYTATKELNGVKYGFTVGGSGYVTYADSGVHNRYENCEFYSPDYIQIMGSGRTGSEYKDCYLNAGHVAFMTQQTGGGTFELTNTTVDTVDALDQIKSGAANTGFSNIIVDNCKINFSGTSTRSKDGILVELVESDDAGNPGITTYTINDHADEAVATMSEVADCQAVFKNGEYAGDIYNCIYNYKQTLNVEIENATLKGAVSATQAIHVDLDGNVVPNGTVLNAFMGSKEYDHANYAAEKGGQEGDCKLIGRYCHTAAPILNNPINVTLKNAAWNVAADGYIQSLTADAFEDITAEAAVTVTTKALTVAGKAYEDGTYTNGNVTIVVDSTEVEVVDNGVADAGQTYGNVAYTFICANEAGEFNSKAVSLKRQNYIDGKLYFKLIPADGVEIVSFSAEGGEISVNTEGGELEVYEHVLAPADGAKEMRVNIVIK